MAILCCFKCLFYYPTNTTIYIYIYISCILVHLTLLHISAVQFSHRKTRMHKKRPLFTSSRYKLLYFYSKTNQMHIISNLFYFGTTIRMFRTVFPSIIMSLRLYIQHQVYVIQVLWLLASKQPQNLYGMMLYVQY